MTASSRTILIRLPVDEKGEPTVTPTMDKCVGWRCEEDVRLALCAAPRVTEDEIVRARVVALPRYKDDDIPMVRDIIAIESFFLPRDDLLRALGVPDVAEKEGT